MALIGLDTSFIKSSLRTWMMPEGGARVEVATSLNTSAVGNAILAATATAAAANVPTRYRIMMGLILASPPLRYCTSAAVTKTNTNTGATAFNAPTNNSPSSPAPKPAFGEMEPTKTPNIKPMMICGTSPIRLTAFSSGLPLAMIRPLTLCVKKRCILKENINYCAGLHIKSIVVAKNA